MTSPSKRTELGVDLAPGVVDIPQSDLTRSLMAALTTGSLEDEKAQDLADGLLNALPPQLKSQINQKEELATSIKERLIAFDQAHRDKTPSEQDFEDLQIQIGCEVMARLSQGIEVKMPLNDGQIAPDLEKQFTRSGRPWVLRTKQMGGYLVVTVSAITSIGGVANLTSKGMDAAVENFDWLQQFDSISDPNVRLALSALGGVLGGVLVTGIALSSFRHEVENNMYERNMGYLRSVKTTLVDMFRGARKMGRVAAFGAIGLLGWDLVTNADGIVTLTAGNVDNAKQLAAVTAQIHDETTKVRAEIAKLPGDAQAQAEASGTTELNKEYGGTSEVRKKGAGPMHGAKAAVLGSLDGRKTVNIGALQGSLGDDLRNALSVTNLDGDSYKDIGVHVKTVVTEGLKPTLEALDDIDATADNLSAGDYKENNAARIRLIQEKFDDVMKQLGPDGKLKGDVNTIVQAYNDALAELGKAAQKHPEIYPDYQAGELAQIGLPEIKIDIPEIKVQKFEWKTAYELIRGFQEKGEHLQAALWLLIAILGGILSSYGDEIADALAGSPVRKVYNEDREKVKDALENLEKIIQAWTDTLTALANGPFRNVLPHRVRIHPTLIKEAIVKAMDARMNPPLPEHKAYSGNGLVSQLWKFGGDTGDLAIDSGRKIRGWIGKASERFLTGDTPDVIDVNHAVKALKDIVENPNELIAIIRSVLTHGVGEQWAEAQKNNDRELIDGNSRVIKAELDRIQGEIPPLPVVTGRAIIRVLMKDSYLRVLSLAVEAIHALGSNRATSMFEANEDLKESILNAGLQFPDTIYSYKTDADSETRQAELIERLTRLRDELNKRIGEDFSKELEEVSLTEEVRGEQVETPNSLKRALERANTLREENTVEKLGKESELDAKITLIQDKIRALEAAEKAAKEARQRMDAERDLETAAQDVFKRLEQYTSDLSDLTNNLARTNHLLLLAGVTEGLTGIVSRTDRRWIQLNEGLTRIKTILTGSLATATANDDESTITKISIWMRTIDAETEVAKRFFEEPESEEE